MPSRRRLQIAALVVLFAAYSGLSHYSNATQARTLGALLALAPMALISTALIARWVNLPIALAYAALGAALLQHYWPILSRNFALVELLQQCAFGAVMAASFGRSLRPERVPLCTQLADKLHGPLNVAELRYTRNVTAAWVIFFLVNLATTIGLFVFAPRPVWSIFVNFCSMPLLLLMFAAELAVRRRVLPFTRRKGLIDTLRVYFAAQS